MIDTYEMLAKFADIFIWSGRSDAVKYQTRSWLTRYLNELKPNTNLKMRRAGDHQPDVSLKMFWLATMTPEDRARLVAVFDDRDRLVKAYRDAGVACFQVAPGNF